MDGVPVHRRAHPGIVGAGPVLFGLVRVRRHRYLPVALVLVAVVVGRGHGRGYYLLSVTPALTAYGAVELTRWRPGGLPRRVLAWPAFVLSLAAVYPLAAAIEVQRRMPAYSTYRGYGYFAPPPETADSALWIGFDGPDPLRPWFRDCTRRPADGLEVWLCTGRTAPWATIWPAARTR